MKKLNSDSRIVAITSMFFVFAFFISMNCFIPCMRSLPDEMGAIALAAKISGLDWSYVLTHPSMYYGSGSAFLLLPFFLLVKNPLILYQCLLGVGAFLRSLVAYIACRIIQKDLKLTNSKIAIFLIGIGASLFTPTRTSNIDNEPMLILLCWIIVFLIFRLQSEQDRKRKMLYTSITAFILAFSYLSHTRAVIYSLSFMIVIFAYYLLKKKLLIHIPAFCFTYALCMAVSIFATTKIKNMLFLSSTEQVVENTAEALANNVVNNIVANFSSKGLQAFFDIFFSNVWVIYVYGAGIIVYAVLKLISYTGNALYISCIKKKIMQIDIIYFPILFCVIGFAISLVGLSVLYIPHALQVHELNKNLHRGHFYLRYYGNFFGPLLIFFIYDFVNSTKKNGVYIWGSIGTLFMCFKYALNSFLIKTCEIHKSGADWFYYFAPFALQKISYPNGKQTLSYFIIASLVSVLLFLLYFAFKKRKQVQVIYLIVPVLLWQYFYGVMYFDRPFSLEDNYFGSVNAMYKLEHENAALFSDFEEIYYINEIYGAEYIVQFMLPHHKVITSLEELDIKKTNVILSSSVLKEDVIDGYDYVLLDANEYLYTNDQRLLKELSNIGYTIIKEETDVLY